MLRFLFTRLSLIIPTFFGMTLLAFFLIRLVPGDPIETLAGERGIDAERHELDNAGRLPDDERLGGFTSCRQRCRGHPLQDYKHLERHALSKRRCNFNR